MEYTPLGNWVLCFHDPFLLTTYRPDPGPLSFTCCGRKGAILSLPLPAQREDTAARGDFAKCIIKHIDEWFAFARDRGLGITRREDIILVTGRHLARSWANIAFQERGERVSFRIQAQRNSDIEWQFTPEGAGGVAFNLGPSGEVGFRTLLLPQTDTDGSLTNLNESESTRKPMHIHQGLPCHSFHIEAITTASGSGRVSSSSK